VQDLSIVTDALRSIVTSAINSSVIFGGPPPFSFDVSGEHPEVPSSNDTELTVYLFHIASNPHLANSFWSASAQHGATPPIAAESMGLDLWYLVSAQSKTGYINAQRLLGIAMQALHDNAIIALATPTPPPDSLFPSHATVTLENPGFDEMSRLWQAFGLPLRTTAQYRVSVAFLTPQTVPTQALPVETMNLVAPPIEGAQAPTLLYSTRRHFEYLGPTSQDLILEQSPATTAPALAAAQDDQTIVLDGAGVVTTDRVVLISHSGGAISETDVTSTWRVGAGIPFRLRVPLVPSPPPPGRYELQLTRPTQPGWRSNRVPLNIAAWVSPAGGPLLNPDPQGRYALTTRNVPAQGAILRVGTVNLTRIANGATPGPGEWECTGGSTATFALPAGMSAGTHLVGLRVNDVESDPVKWAVV
jgi:hypothetical protein